MSELNSGSTVRVVFSEFILTEYVVGLDQVAVISNQYSERFQPCKKTWFTRKFVVNQVFLHAFSDLIGRPPADSKSGLLAFVITD